MPDTIPHAAAIPPLPNTLTASHPAVDVRKHAIGRVSGFAAHGQDVGWANISYAMTIRGGTG